MATRWDNLPGLNDDVVERSIEDYKKMKKGQNVDSSKIKGSAREVVREAGQRGQNRNAGRAGLAGAALQAGYEVGRALDERTGAGKKIVGGSNILRTIGDELGSSARVKFSADAKQRIADMENDKALREIDAEKEGMKKGGKVKKYARGGGIEQRGKTRGRFV